MNDFQDDEIANNIAIDTTLDTLLQLKLIIYMKTYYELCFLEYLKGSKLPQGFDRPINKINNISVYISHLLLLRN
jgi:hypothetical protein